MPPSDAPLTAHFLPALQAWLSSPVMTKPWTLALLAAVPLTAQQVVDMAHFDCLCGAPSATGLTAVSTLYTRLDDADQQRAFVAVARHAQRTLEFVLAEPDPCVWPNWRQDEAAAAVLAEARACNLAASARALMDLLMPRSAAEAAEGENISFLRSLMDSRSHFSGMTLMGTDAHEG